MTAGSIVTYVDGDTTSTTVSGLTNGQQVSVSVASMNDFYGVQPIWNSAGPVTVVPAGAPIWTASPTGPPENDSSGTVTVSWQGAVDPNGSAITAYSVSCASGTFGGDATSDDCTLGAGARSTITVTAKNSVGSTVSAQVPANPPAPPATPSRVFVSVADPRHEQSRHFTPTLQGVFPATQAPGGAQV